MLKKLALIFGFLVVTLQLPFCPYRVLPGDLAASMEYGRQWTSVFLQAYGITDAAPAGDVAVDPVPEIALVTVSAAPVAPESCPYEVPEVAPLPPAHVPVSFDVADLPAIPEYAELTQVDVPHIQIELDLDSSMLTPEVRAEMQKAMQDFRQAMQEVQKHSRTRADHAERIKSLKIRMERVRKSLAPRTA